MAKKIRESGVVLSKFIKPAMESFESNGRIIPAYPERPTVLIGCGEVDGENGIVDLVIVRYVVDMELYEKLSYMQTIEAAYEYNGEGKAKPVEIYI